MTHYNKSIIDIPTLFVTFARPEYAQQTFNAIRKAKPRKLYFYSNKARNDSPDEVDRNNHVRALVNEIDWDCELKTFFRDEYVDMFTSIWSAIDWVFDNEEQAIILEEDCVPSVAFFDFCEQLLHKFKSDQRIWVVSGNNFIEGYNPNGYDYFFSPFAYQYGWASWRSRWNQINRNGFSVNDIIRYKLYRQILCTGKGENYAKKWLIQHQDSDGVFRTKAWDIAFQLSMRCNGSFGVVPKVNLVSNIGTHGVNNSGNINNIHNRVLPEGEKYIIKTTPPFIVSDFSYTNRFFEKITLYKTPFLIRVLKYMKKRIHGNKSKNN